MKLEDENEPKKDISQEELKELRKRAKQMENKL